MTRDDLKKAIKKITERNLTGREQEALETFIGKAIEEGTDETFQKALAAIDYLYMAERINLVDSFELADLIG